ncbi:MAG: hypothetical protein DHS20C03_03210 [Minwuia thermotolerans]|nr:MAG: hypothetical protein DHS20C03_03210 [Minwuia thermotolerans]
MIEPGPAVLIHLLLARTRNLQSTSWSEPLGGKLFGSFAKALCEIVPRDDDILHPGVATPHNNMGMRMTCIVMIDGDPIETSPDIAFHFAHELAG